MRCSAQAKRPSATRIDGCVSSEVDDADVLRDASVLRRKGRPGRTSSSRGTIMDTSADLVSMSISMRLTTEGSNWRRANGHVGELGARNSLFVPELDTFFVAIPQAGERTGRAPCLPSAQLMISGRRYRDSGPSQSHSPTVQDASASPAKKAIQNPRFHRCANASGTKNGRPSGTRISVSRASREMLPRSCLPYQVLKKARMLTNGSVSRNAPKRGVRFETADTDATTAPAMTARISNCHMWSSRQFGFAPSNATSSTAANSATFTKRANQPVPMRNWAGLPCSATVPCWITYT